MHRNVTQVTIVLDWLPWIWEGPNPAARWRPFAKAEDEHEHRKAFRHKPRKQGPGVKTRSQWSITAEQACDR